MYEKGIEVAIVGCLKNLFEFSEFCSSFKMDIVIIEIGFISFHFIQKRSFAENRWTVNFHNTHTCMFIIDHHIHTYIIAQILFWHIESITFSVLWSFTTVRYWVSYNSIYIMQIFPVFHFYSIFAIYFPIEFVCHHSFVVSYIYFKYGYNECFMLCWFSFDICCI
jgi:hypothetical protein